MPCLLRALTAESHLGGGVLRPFVFLLSTIVRALMSLAVLLLGKAHKDSVHTVVIAIVYRH